MSGGFKVVLGDLAALAETFGDESQHMDRLRPQMSPEPVSGGDNIVDSAIAATLALFGAANAALAHTIADHADKLKRCHDEYTATDADLVALYTKLIGQA